MYARFVTARLKKKLKQSYLKNNQDLEKGDRVQTILYSKTINIKRQFNHELYLLFVYYVKTFYRVHREELWNMLYKRGRPIPHHLIAVIKNMYKGREISLIANCGKVLTAEINL
jgi:hypothetical protein